VVVARVGLLSPTSIAGLFSDPDLLLQPLKRRARTETRDIASMFEDDEPASSFRGGLRTQDPAPSLDSSYPATMDVDDGAFVCCFSPLSPRGSTNRLLCHS
jgi:hypothetical protein